MGWFSDHEVIGGGLPLPAIPITAPDELTRAVDEVADKWSVKDQSSDNDEETSERNKGILSRSRDQPSSPDCYEKTHKGSYQVRNKPETTLRKDAPLLGKPAPYDQQVRNYKRSDGRHSIEYRGWFLACSS